jgi:diadenosine tetraphosphate (Ap4A) HIT family hydrolase
MTDHPLDPTTVTCFSCSQTVELATLPPREALVVEGGWRIAHAFNSALPGWLVVLPMRHITSMDELTSEEAEALGSLLRRASRALSAVVGSAKAYVMFFAEAEGFAHLHVHVVPRMEWFTPDQLGPRVFTFLGGPESERVRDDDMDELALRLRAAFAAES